MDRTLDKTLPLCLYTHTDKSENRARSAMAEIRMREKKKHEEMRTKLVHHRIMRSVSVVYYLSRNGQLQHPHFMEVPLSSPQEGLFLTDIINRLSVLRGKAMPAMYSWSCKRSYKNGFVWHDLSENDFIHPAHGHDEYVLKGSELLPDDNENTADTPPEKHHRRRNMSCSSIDFNHGLREYSVYQASSNTAAADASTQTDDAGRRTPYKQPQQRDEIEVSTSPPPSDSSPETLETLMEVDRRRRRHEAAGGRSSVLMQLISCGSISCGAGHVGMGLISRYKTRVPRGKLDEKEYFSGSILADTKKEKFPTLKRSTSCNADHHHHR